MGRPAKILAWVIAAIVAVFVLAAIALTLFFNPNDFRENIAKAVHESTGREFRIDGDISVQFFPWLAVEIGHAALGNAEGFGDGPFAEFDQAELSVRIMPLLLRQEAEIGTARIDGLRLRFEVDKQGRTNWDDLLEGGNGDVGEAGGGSGGSLDIAGIDLSDASISYAHQQKGDRYELTDVNLSIGRVSSDAAPIPLNGSVHFDVQPSGLSGDVEVETIVTFDAETGVFELDGFSMAGVTEGIASTPTRMSFETAGIEIQSADNLASIEPVTIALLDMNIHAEVEPFFYEDEIQPTAQVRVEAFSPRNLMHLFEVEAPETADPNALTSVSITAKAYVRENNISLTGVNMVLDETSFTGAMTVPTDGAGRFFVKLKADALDMNRYMAPPGEEGGDAAIGKSAPVEIPADLIKPLNARGDLTIGTVTIGGLTLDEVVLSLTAGNGQLRIHPITADLYGGKYSGDVRINASSAEPVLSMNETVQNVDMAKLALAMFEQQNITGSISGNFKLSGRGNDLDAVQRSLSGNMNFELKDGTYEGTDVWYELRKARALLKKEEQPEPVLPARTSFSSVKATGVVTNGIMRNDDFAAELSFMQLTGNGNVDIPAGSVDYSLRARVFHNTEAQENATPEEIEDFRETVIPLKITGSLSDPKVRPDVEALLRQRVEEEIEDLLKDRLQDLLRKNKDEDPENDA